MRFAIDSNTHVTVDRLTEEIKVRREQALDRAAAQARGRLAEQLGSTIVGVFNLATVIKIDDTVFDLADKLLQEPVGALIPKACRRVILSAQHRQEKTQELVPYQEMETADTRIETIRNRDDEIE